MEAKPDGFKILIMILSGVLIALCSGWLSTKPGDKIVGALGGLFAVSTLFLMFYRLLFCRPALIVSPEGFESRWWGIPLVTWAEIEQMKINYLGSQRRKFLTITFHHPENIYRRMSVISRVWWKLNCAMGYGHAAISSGGLDANVETLYFYVSRFLNTTGA